jgi:hypothetical protein
MELLLKVLVRTGLFVFHALQLEESLFWRMPATRSQPFGMMELIFTQMQLARFPTLRSL